MYHRRPTVFPARKFARHFVVRAGENSSVTALGWTALDTPVGQLSVGCSDKGVAEVRFGGPPASATSATSGAPATSGAAGISAAQAGLVTAARDQLAEYFRGTRSAFDLPLDWGSASRARREILGLLAGTVRYGQTITYGSLARRQALRDGRPVIGARAIGSIMGSNPIPVIVPCHRVVAADGLGGYSGGSGPEVKRWLLTFEGALPAMLDFGAAAARAR